MQEIILFATGIAAVQIIPVYVFHDEQSEALQIEEAFMISMFMLLNVFAMVAAVSLAIITNHTLNKKPWYKLLFNLINSGIAAAASITAAHTIGGLTGAAMGALIYTILTATGIFLLFKKLGVQFTLDLPFRIVMLGTAIILGLAMYTNPAAMPIIAILTIGTQMWYQSTRRPILSLIQT